MLSSREQTLHKCFKWQNKRILLPIYLPEHAFLAWIKRTTAVWIIYFYSYVFYACVTYLCHFKLKPNYAILSAKRWAEIHKHWSAHTHTHEQHDDIGARVSVTFKAITWLSGCLAARLPTDDLLAFERESWVENLLVVENKSYAVVITYIIIKVCNDTRMLTHIRTLLRHIVVSSGHVNVGRCVIGS